MLSEYSMNPNHDDYISSLFFFFFFTSFFSLVILYRKREDLQAAPVLLLYLPYSLAGKKKFLGQLFKTHTTPHTTHMPFREQFCDSCE